MDIPSNLGSGSKITAKSEQQTSATTPQSSTNSKSKSHKVVANKSQIHPVDSLEGQLPYKKQRLENRTVLQDRKALTSKISSIDVNSDLDIESILSRDDVEQLQQLINTDASEKKIYMHDSNKRTLLHKAAEYGASHCVRMLIEKLPDDVWKEDIDGCLALHLAALKGHTDCVKILVEINPDTLKHENCLEQTPVLLAAKHGKIDTLEAMLDHEEGIRALSIDDKKDLTPLGWVVKNIDVDCLKFFAKKYPHMISARDYNGFTPLHHAAKNGHIKCIEFLVKEAPECLSCTSIKNKKPIQLAIEYGRTDALKYMLDLEITKKQLTQIELYDDFIADNSKYEQLIQDAREKNKMPFKPVQDFDRERFKVAYLYHQRKHSLTVEALIDRDTSSKKKVNKYSATDRLNLNPQIETAPDELIQAKALLAGLGSVGVYAECRVYKVEKENKFWSLGDASACIKMIRTLASLGAKNIHVQLSPPDDSAFCSRKHYRETEDQKWQEEYNEKQRIALSKLAYLLPEFNVKNGTPQEISVYGSKVIISCCDDPVEDTPVTLSFLGPAKKHLHCGQLVDKNYIFILPYLLCSKHKMIFTDIEYLKANIIPINAPTNSVLSSLDTNEENDTIKPQSNDYNKEVLFDSINQLCNYSENKQALVGVVYGLHHKKIGSQKQIAILTNWIDAIKAKVKKTGDDRPIVIMCTANALDSKTIEKVIEATGVKVIDFNDADARNGVISSKSSEIVLGVMPSLPQTIFDKLVRYSNLPTLTEGANLTSFLLQNGQPHLSLLPSGKTPVAQDMGYPLEALKAQAFSYKLAISKEEKENNKLEKLLELVKENKYQEALLFVKEIKESSGVGKLDFLWRTPKQADSQLKSVTIMSLLEKGENMGSIEKEALISAIDPSDAARANYIESCQDEDSPTTDHFKLQQMHVNQSFNNLVASALVKFGKIKNLL